MCAPLTLSPPPPVALFPHAGLMGAQSGKVVLKLDEGNATIRESGKLENATIRGTATRSTCMRLRGR